MKYTLLIMRHAKSDWSDENCNDLERTLNKRGFKDAPMMGERIAQMGYFWDKIISSPARRAIMSAQSVADSISFTSNIEVDDRLYLKGIDSIEEVLSRVKDDIHTLMLFGHNPDFHELYEKLSGQSIKKFPTASYAIFEFDAPFSQQGEAKLLWFDKPKSTRLYE